MSIEWVFAVVLVGAFAFLTLAFHRPTGRPIRTRGTRGTSGAIRWDAPLGR